AVKIELSVTSITRQFAASENFRPPRPRFIVSDIVAHDELTGFDRIKPLSLARLQSLSAFALRHWQPGCDFRHCLLA
ncbi:MAG: hypothetical protein ACPHE0_00950, partial [Pseudomonadales bacterium]